MRHVKQAVAVLSFLAISPVHADSATAEALFRDGRDLIKHGKLAAGCDKIGASQKLDPSVGTLLNLGDCREKLGQLASAWGAFREAESLAKRKGGDDKRLAEASKRAAALEPKLSNIVIEVPQPVDGLIIRRGDEVVDRAAWNTPLPVDPATHVIVAEAPGFKPWRLEVAVDPRSRRRVVQVPRLEPSTDPGASPIPAPVIVQAPLTAVMFRTKTRPRTWSTTRGVAVAIGVLGAGGIVTGAYFGNRSDDLQQRSDAICPTAVCDDLEGLRLNDDAKRHAMRANIAFAAGGAALITSTVMWFLGKPSDEIIVAPTMTSREAGVSLRGRF